MTDAEQHIKQWKHNRSFIQAIDPIYNDWIVTGLFYTALHAVDTLLAHKGNKATDHQQRNGILCHTHSYSHIWKLYRPLYSISREIRYFADPACWISPQAIKQDVIIRYIYPIEKSVQKLIGKELKLPKIEIREAAIDATPET